MQKYVYYNNLRFTRDEITGYYLNSTKRKRLHRYIWECEKGKIPKGYHVHHVDHDKNNNTIDNLELISASDHASYHGDINAKLNYDLMIDNLNKNARPKASEWHGSEDGIKWHKEHYQKNKDKLHKEYDFKCNTCGKEFTTTNINSKFCSNYCKSKYRLIHGLDNEVRVCEYCSKEFETNKYSKLKTCSRTCAMKKRHRDKKIKKESEICK